MLNEQALRVTQHQTALSPSFVHSRGRNLAHTPSVGMNHNWSDSVHSRCPENAVRGRKLDVPANHLGRSQSLDERSILSTDKHADGEEGPLLQQCL